MKKLRSSIDLGTNTCLLLIAEWDEKSRQWGKIVQDLAEVVRLGQGVDQHGELQPVAMQRALDCLKQYSQKVKEAGLEPAETLSVATAQARDARNGNTFFAQVRELTGFNFQVISGSEEARLSFMGALGPGIDPKQALVIDIGGGSTEYVMDSGGLSLQMGSVRFTERYLPGDPVSEKDFKNCISEVDKKLHELDAWKARTVRGQICFLGIAGTVTTLAQWDLGLKQFDRQAIDGHILKVFRLENQVKELQRLSITERLRLPGLTAGRADVLLAGAIILWRSALYFSQSEIRTSVRGLRYGALSDWGSAAK